MLTNEELDIIQHATGRNYTPRRVRNYFLAGAGPDLSICRSLVDRGFMRGGQAVGWCAGDTHFSVTPEGESAYFAQRPQKSLSRSQKRYRDWLAADSSLKFGEWLRQRQYDHEGAWVPRDGDL